MFAERIFDNQRKLLANKLRDKLGFYFPDDRLDEMSRRLKDFLNNLDDKALSRLLESDWDQSTLDNLVKCVTIGETYFFRDPKLWHQCSQEILPDMVSMIQTGHRETINIWSAACSTGEEPYTLSLVIRQHFPNYLHSKFRIVASDINKSSLQHAQNGVYSKWSMRSTSEDVLQRYFHCEAGKFKLSKEVIGSVQFFYHNLIDNSHPFASILPPKFDLIFCRNVLMYFQKDQIISVIQKLSSYLHEGGWLILSPQDIWHTENFTELEIVALPELILLRKKGIGSQTGQTHPESKSSELSEFELGSAVKAHPQPITEDLLSEMDKYARLSQEFTIQIKNNDYSSDEINYLIQEQIKYGDYTAALSYCDLSIKSRPLSSSLYYLKSSILSEIGQLPEAIKSLQQAIFLEPDFIIAHFALFNIHRKLGRAELASLSYKNTRRLLNKRDASDIVPEADGLTAGQLLSLLKSAVPEAD